MASDNHASYARIGFTVALGVFAIVATLIYLGGLRGHRNVLLVETYSDKPVTGLSVGSVVNLRGVKIGEVREIALLGTKYDVDDRNMTRIYILMAFMGDMINPSSSADPGFIEEKIRGFVSRRGLRATVSVNGITGLARIELDYNDGEEFKNAPPIPWTPEHVCIPPKDSLIESFSVAATKVMNTINKMDLNVFWSNLNSSVEHVSQCAETANDMIQARQADVERILENLTTTSESLRELSAELRRDPSALVRGVDRPALDETAR